jgi:tellurite resistance protein TerB
MGFFGALKKAVSSGAREVSAEYGQNKDFLEAVCAGCALVAFADGELEESERLKAVQIITTHSVLSKLYQRDIIEQTLDIMFKRAKDSSGRQALARELDDIKGKPNATQMAEDIYLIASDISMADGELEPQEEAVLKKIAARLGVDPSRFEF